MGITKLKLISVYCSGFILLSVLNLPYHTDGGEVFKDTVNEFQFGSVTQIFDGTQSSRTISSFPFTYIVADPNSQAETKYFISTDSTIFRFTPSTSALTFYVGQLPTDRLQQGINSGSPFQSIRGMLSSPVDNKTLWVVDASRNCILSVNSSTQAIQEVTGGCDMNVKREGNINRATFGRITPLSLVSSREYYFFDNIDKVLSKLYYTYSGQSWKIKDIGYYNISRMINYVTPNLSGDLVYLVDDYGIWYINIWSAQSRLKLLLLPSVGFMDGGPSAARINGSNSIVFLSDDVFLLADRNNHKIRVFDFTASFVSSICRLQQSGLPEVEDGTVESCKIINPTSMVKHPTENKVLIVGDSNVYELTYTSSKDPAVTTRRVDLRVNTTRYGHHISPVLPGRPVEETENVTANSTTQSTDDAMSQTEAQIDTRLIVGVSLAVGALVLLLVFGFVYRSRWRDNQKNDQHPDTDFTKDSGETAYPPADHHGSKSHSKHSKHKKKKKHHSSHRSRSKSRSKSRSDSTGNDYE